MTSYYVNNCNKCRCCPCTCRSISTLNVTYPNIDTNDTVFVDVEFGDDATGLRETLNYPFQTLTAALAAADPEDLIYVWPGTYNTAKLVIDKNVDFYFSAGAIVVGSDGVFEVTSAAVVNITGYGDFQTEAFPVLLLTSTSTGSDVIFKALRSTGTSYILQVESASLVSMEIDFIFLGTVPPSLGFLVFTNADSEIYVRFIKFVTDSGLLYASSLASGRIKIEGEYMVAKVSDDANVIHVLSSDIRIDVIIREILFESKSRLLLSSLLLSSTTEIYIKSDLIQSKSVLMQITNVLDGSVVLDVIDLQIEAETETYLIYSANSNLNIKNRNLDITLLAGEVFHVIGSSQVRLTSSSVTYVNSGSDVFLISDNMSLDRSNIIMDIQSMTLNNGLLDLTNNVLATMTFGYLNVSDYSEHVVVLRNTSELVMKCDTLVVNVVRDGTMGVFSSTDSKSTYILTNAVVDVNASLFDFLQGSVGYIKSNYLQVTTGDSILTSTDSNVIVDIDKFIPSTSQHVFDIVSSVFTLTLHDEVSVSSPFLNSTQSTLSLTLERLTVDATFFLTSVLDNITMEFDILRATTQAVSFMSLDTSEAFIRGSYLDFAGADRGMLLNNSTANVDVNAINFVGINTAIETIGTSVLNLEANVFDLGIGLANTLKGILQLDLSYVNVHISKMNVQDTLSTGFIVQNDASFDGVVDKYNGVFTAVNFDTTGVVSYITKSTITTSDCCFLNLYDGSDVTYGGYFRSDTGYILVINSEVGSNIVRFLSSTLVSGLLSLISSFPVAYPVQFEQSIGNVVVGANVAPYPAGTLVIDANVV